MPVRHIFCSEWQFFRSLIWTLAPSCTLSLYTCMFNDSAISKGVDLLGVSVTPLCRERREECVVGEDTV